MTNRLFIIPLLLLALNQFAGTMALAASVLNVVHRTDESTHLQFFFHFDQLPAFTATTTGKKVDLELQDTVLNETPITPATDGRMIKLVTNQQKSKTILSFYFRYPPQKVTPESNKETAMLMLDVLLGNPPAASHAELSPKPPGGSGGKKGAESESLNPVTASSYAKNWQPFFTEYESPVEIGVSPRLVLPPFPLATTLQPKIADETWLSLEIQALAKENKWTRVCQLLREQLISQPDEKLKERLVFTYAEALVRGGEYKEPYILLQKIALQYPDTLMADLARFLLIYQQALRGSHITAYYELGGLVKKIEKDSPLMPSFNILLAELALMAGRPADAEKLLGPDDIPRSEQLNNIRLLRQADLFYAKNEKVKALTAYLNLAGKSPVIDIDPMSLAHFCDVLYADKRFSEAAKKYQTLSNLLNNEPKQDLALFRLAMSQLHLPEMVRKARANLLQIQDAFAQTEGGVRAQLKQTDLDFVSKRVDATAAEAVYRKFAIGAETIMLREEASFKQALVNALAGKHQASVTLCMELLRGFQSGKLRHEAKALLIQQLPEVIKELIKEKEYVKALVLAKQNKTFFAKGWLNTDLLYDLASAYSKLGMTEQTAQTYQYLFEISSDKDKEKIYLPLLQTLSAAGRPSQVEEYADRYLLRYPKGTDVAAVFLLKVRALYESGQLDKVVNLLKSKDRPKLPQLELLSSRIYFEKKQWHNVIDTLTKPELHEILMKNNMALLLGESYFQIGQDDLAAPVFRQIIATGNGNEQAQFRMAQIVSKKNDTPQALNLFKELAEKGKDPLWTKLAREEVAILQLQQKK